MRIKNLSKKKVNLPEGLLFKNREGDILPPLTAVEEAQPLSDTLEVKIQTTDRLIKELTAQVKALDELIQD